MCQYQGEPFEWEAVENGSVRVKFKDKNSEFIHFRAANEEELEFIKVISVMRKVTAPPYLLKHKTNYSLKELYPNLK